VISLGSNIIDALESTYRERIVHRDIKPENIMYRNDFEAVLVDFGLVRDLNATSLTQTFHMRGPGTPIYSAPEQLTNNKAMIDWRTDQFALGITLCLAAFGIHPFEMGTPIKTIERMASFERCSVHVKARIAASGLTPLIKMIEPYPIGRYRTPAYLKNDWNNLEVVK
jgi:serine/threonine protein kinase